MLALRLQRTGRKGYATYRLIVQEAQLHPSSGRVVARLGNYNPHTKEKNLDVEAASKYLNNGAQPSPRVISLLEEAGVKMPAWVNKPVDHKKSIKNPEKLRRNQPKEEEPVSEEAPVEEAEATAEPAEA